MTINTAELVLISVVLTTAVLYLLFKPYINMLREQQIVLQEVGRDEASPLEDDCEAELVGNEEANKVWQDAINEFLAREISQDQLLKEYSKTLLAMWDKVDPYYAEGLTMAPISKILRTGNRSRQFSFLRFVKSLGK